MQSKLSNGGEKKMFVYFCSHSSPKPFLPFWSEAKWPTIIFKSFLAFLRTQIFYSGTRIAFVKLRSFIFRSRNCYWYCACSLIIIVIIINNTVIFLLQIKFGDLWVRIWFDLSFQNYSFNLISFLCENKMEIVAKGQRFNFERERKKSADKKYSRERDGQCTCSIRLINMFQLRDLMVGDFDRNWLLHTRLQNAGLTSSFNKRDQD